MDALGKDCSLQGAMVWRLSSLAALSCILSTLGSTSAGIRREYGTHAFVQALQVLLQRGHLQSILGNVGTFSTSTAAALTSQLTHQQQTRGEATDNTDNEALFMSVLNMCTQVASSVEGAEALLQCNVMQRLVSLDYFVTPPAFPDEIAYFGRDAQVGDMGMYSHFSYPLSCCWF